MQKIDRVCVENVEFATEMDRRVAVATVRLGEVVIHGVAIWMSPQGKLRVFVPSYKRGNAFKDAISLPHDLQAEVNAAVISAYQDIIKDKAVQTPDSVTQKSDKNPCMRPSRVFFSSL
jgi:hypothetical protein